MKSDQTKTLLWAAVSAAVLGIGFAVCRYALFDLHGMKGWPRLLFLLGLAVLCAAAFFRAKRVMLCTALGYPAAFLLGLLFRSEGIDIHGGATDNLWVWFTFLLAGFVLLGAGWEAIVRRRKA